jgi:hypothetical protein
MNGKGINSKHDSFPIPLPFIPLPRLSGKRRSILACFARNLPDSVPAGFHSSVNNFDQSAQLFLI